MFVKHCPDSGLSCIFKCKPICEWTSRDIQVRIDEYQRELRATVKPNVYAHLKSHSAMVVESESQQTICTPANVKNQSVNSTCPSFVSALPCTASACTGSALLQSHVQHPETTSFSQSVQQTDDDVLGRIMSMLEKVLSKVEQRSASSSAHRQKPRSDLNSLPCKVCGGNSHSTLSHCKSDHLCFSCLAPGHSRQHCPNRPPPHFKPNQGN